MDPREKEIVRAQNKQIYRLLQTFKTNRRHARSIDFIGSALKFIAGTPDHSDFELLLTKEDMIIQNNNKQTNINSALQNKINELTQRINVLQDKLKTSNAIGKDDLILLELLTARNGDIIFFLNQLSLSITLAKANIVNPVILDNVEINHILENEMVPLSLNNILKASNISIFQNDNNLLYVIKIPLISNFCKYSKIHPVIRKKSTIKLDINESSQCNSFNTPITNCIKAGETRICKIAPNTCLSHLLNNNSASCETESADNIPNIQLVNDGMLLLNDVCSTNVTDGEILTVKGTVLVTFSNNITVNGTIFFNPKQRWEFIEPHPPKTINLRNMGHDTKLSLPYLHKIYLENTNYIEKIESEILTHKLIILTFVIAVPLIAWVVNIIRKRNKTEPLNIEQIRADIISRSRDAPIQKGGAVNSG